MSAAPMEGDLVGLPLGNEDGVRFGVVMANYDSWDDRINVRLTIPNSFRLWRAPVHFLRRAVMTPAGVRLTGKIYNGP